MCSYPVVGALSNYPTQYFTQSLLFSNHSVSILRHYYACTSDKFQVHNQFENRPDEFVLLLLLLLILIEKFLYPLVVTYYIIIGHDLTTRHNLNKSSPIIRISNNN